MLVAAVVEDASAAEVGSRHASVDKEAAIAVEDTPEDQPEVVRSKVLAAGSRRRDGVWATAAARDVGMDRSRAVSVDEDGEEAAERLAGQGRPACGGDSCRRWRDAPPDRRRWPL